MLLLLYCTTNSSKLALVELKMINMYLLNMCVSTVLCIFSPPQSHKASATVKLTLEAFVAFFDEGSAWSNDNMNKIKANGTTAVSRYHQPRGFFLQGDVPSHGDHDFPISRYTVTVSGYKELVLTQKMKEQVEYPSYSVFDDLDQTCGSTRSIWWHNRSSDNSYSPQFKISNRNGGSLF